MKKVSPDEAVEEIRNGLKKQAEVSGL